MLVDSRSRGRSRIVWTVVLGFCLGGIFTMLAEMFLPESVGRTFLTTAVEASVGPLSVDLIALTFTLGPFTIYLNVLTLVGVAIVAFVARSWI